MLESVTQLVNGGVDEKNAGNLNSFLNLAQSNPNPYKNPNKSVYSNFIDKLSNCRTVTFSRINK